MNNAALPAVTEQTETSLVEVIARAAKDPSTDVEKLERLMGLYERIGARQAEQAFNEAMKAAQAEMPQIVKDAENDYTKSRYARLENVNKVITPVVTKHGFALSFGTADSSLQGHYRVTCHVSHAAGHSRDYHVDIPADTKGAKGGDTKTATHGFGSSMSYGRRYLTLLIFNIATRQTADDDDGNGGLGADKISAEQVGILQALIDETKSDIPKFLAYMGVKELAEIPLKNYHQARVALERKRGKAQ